MIEGERDERDLLPISLEIYTEERGEGLVGRRTRGRSEDQGGGVFALRMLKNGECQNEIKKNVERESGREGEVGESKSR